MQEDKILDFVKPYYDKKDIMHNFSHIERLKKLALKFSESYPDAKTDLIIYGSYMHGVIHIDEKAVKKFLSTLFSEQEVEKIVQVSWESNRLKKAKTIEGKILHDAHILEGGKTYFIAKSLITSSLKGQSLIESIEYIENNIIGKFKVYLEESKILFAEKEKYTIEFIEDLKSHI